ncbi:MAG: MFS transporter [Ktedonobacteraceae bacterium]
MLAFFGFALVGVSGGIWGVLLPSLSDYYHVDNSIIGLLFVVSSTGYFLSAFLGGILVERLGMRGFLVLGAGTFLLGAFAFGLKLPFMPLLLVRLSFGFGAGIIETGLNIYVSTLPRSASLLNYLHAFYGVGALVGPVIASTILVLNWGWNSVYFMLAGLSLPMFFGFWLFFKRKTAVVSSTQDVQKGNGNTLGTALKLGVVWVAALFLLVYVGVEVSLGNWTYTFLLEDRHQNTLLSGWVVSGYWFGLTMGRFVLQSLAERLRISNTMLIYGCMANVIVSIGLIWLIPVEIVAAVAFCLIGFSLGPIYPLTVALAPKLVPARIAPSAIGFLISISIIGLALFPWFAGILAQSVGIWSLLPYNIVLTLVMIGLWWGLFRGNGMSQSSQHLLEE